MKTLRSQDGTAFAWEVLRRFLRIRWGAAALLSLPVLVLCAWYLWRVQTTMSGYSSALGKDRGPTIDDYQLLLHDIMLRDLRILSMDRTPPPSVVKRFDLELGRRDRARLMESAERNGDRPNVPAKLVSDGQVESVEVQLRGKQPWHVAGASRSMRVRLPKGQLFDGHRVFNLINDPSPFVVGDQVVLEIARELRVLVPRTSFARVSMNGRDLGVFRYQTQPDESLLRMWHRIPGSMYVGDLKRGAPTNALWADASMWEKDASRTAGEEDTRDELERLITLVSAGTIAQFVDFARHEVDLSAFARLEAIDIAFGSEERGFRQDHRLYFDPYKGRWEPVVWSFRAFKHEPAFDLVENPLLMRLKQVPEYSTLLATTLFALLTHEGSVDSVRQRSRHTLEALAPELRADRDWYAHKLLPRIDDFHRRMLRPMTLDRAALSLASEVETYARRHAYLMRTLSKNPLGVALGAPSGDAQMVQLRLLGQAGVRIDRVQVTPAEGCRDLTWTLRYGERALVPEASAAEGTIVPFDVLPAFQSQARPSSDENNGGIRFVPVEATHELRLHASCAIDEISLFGSNLATGSKLHALASSEPSDGWRHRERIDADSVPAFQVGALPYVPEPRWAAETKNVRLGPGDIDIPSTRVFDEAVEIAGGTRFRMGPGASLVFLGRVRMAGTRAEPIVVSGLGGGAWGGIAIQGPGTAGSELTHVSIRGGTSATWRQVTFPATVSIHDTRDISLRGCQMEGNGAERDMLHAAYVQELRLLDTTVQDAAMDGLDLELVSGSLQGLRVISVKDDAVDLMGSTVEIQDAVLAGGNGNGLSAGEASQVTSTHLFVSGFDVGVLAKNVSEVRLAGALLYRNHAGIRVYRKESRFEGESQLRADELFVVECEETMRLDRQSAASARLVRVRRSLPADGSLDFLRAGVLGIDSWRALPGWVAHSHGGS